MAGPAVERGSRLGVGSSLRHWAALGVLGYRERKGLTKFWSQMPNRSLPLKCDFRDIKTIIDMKNKCIKSRRKIILTFAVVISMVCLQVI